MLSVCLNWKPQVQKILNKMPGIICVLFHSKNYLLSIFYFSSKNGQIEKKRQTNMLIEHWVSNSAINFHFYNDLDLEGQIFNLHYLWKKWSQPQTKNKHIDRKLGLKCGNQFLPWTYPWLNFCVQWYLICKISGKMVTEWKTNIWIEY